MERLRLEALAEAARGGVPMKRLYTFGNWVKSRSEDCGRSGSKLVPVGNAGCAHASAIMRARAPVPHVAGVKSQAAASDSASHSGCGKWSPMVSASIEWQAVPGKSPVSVARMVSKWTRLQRGSIALVTAHAGADGSLRHRSIVSWALTNPARSRVSVAWQAGGVKVALWGRLVGDELLDLHAEAAAAELRVCWR